MNKEQIEPVIRVAAEQRERFGEPSHLFKGIGSEKTAAALLGMCVKPLDVRAALRPIHAIASASPDSGC